MITIPVRTDWIRKDELGLGTELSGGGISSCSSKLVVTVGDVGEGVYAIEDSELEMVAESVWFPGMVRVCSCGCLGTAGSRVVDWQRVAPDLLSDRDASVLRTRRPNRIVKYEIKATVFRVSAGKAPS